MLPADKQDQKNTWFKSVCVVNGMFLEDVKKWLADKNSQTNQSALQLVTVPPSQAPYVEIGLLEEQITGSAYRQLWLKAQADEHSHCPEQLCFQGNNNPVDIRIGRYALLQMFQMIFNLVIVFPTARVGVHNDQQGVGPAFHPPHRRVSRVRQMWQHLWLARSF